MKIMVSIKIIKDLPLTYNYLALIFICILSYQCSTKVSEKSVSKSSEEYSNEYVVKIDYFEDSTIQRFFVTSDTSIKSIRNVLNLLKKKNKVTLNTNISFFIEEKYAKYLEEFKINVLNDSTSKFIKNWKEEFYFGEYSFSDDTFTKYPASESSRTLQIPNMTNDIEIDNEKER